MRRCRTLLQLGLRTLSLSPLRLVLELQRLLLVSLLLSRSSFRFAYPIRSYVERRLPFSLRFSITFTKISRWEDRAHIKLNISFFCTKVTVALDLQTTGGFEFAGNLSEIELFVRAQDSRTIRFPIVPKKLGRIPLRVSAYSALESDAVLRMLLVEVRLSYYYYIL